MHSRVSLHARQISHPPYSALIKLQVDRTCVFSNLVSYVRRVNAPDALHRLAARLSTAVEPKDDGSPAEFAIATRSFTTSHQLARA